MPNTLAHLGVQALVTRGIIRSAPMGWIWLGCVLPDLPWIGQRAMRAMPLPISPLDIRLHATAQSSLLFCLFLAGAAALLARRPGQAFAVLALGAALHLGLDATQTKWANGVVLAAPLDWRVLNLGLYWPESVVSLALTVLGGAVFAWACIAWRPPRDIDATGRRRPVLAGALAALWLVGPVAVLPAVEAADAHYVATLRAVAERDGRAIAFDRAGLIAAPDGTAALRIWTGETLRAIGVAAPRAPRTVSVRGRFDGSDAIEIGALHVHATGWRDLMSYLGLGLVTAWWPGIWLSRRFRRD